MLSSFIVQCRSYPLLPMSRESHKDAYLSGYQSPDPNILFDDRVIKSLDYSQTPCYVEYGLTYQHLSTTKDGRQLIARPLQKSDFSKGYLPLLSQLTTVGSYSEDIFEAQFSRMQNMPGCHYVLVVEDQGSRNGITPKVVATATLVVECKFIHSAAFRGRIEDVVVDSAYRGMHLGSFLLDTLKLLSQALHCYKVTLDCKEPMLPYYTKLGYDNEGQYFLSHRFTD